MNVANNIDFKSEIKKIAKEKNAVILAHYYQNDDIQDIADHIGDSLALAQWAKNTTADIIWYDSWLNLIPENYRNQMTAHFFNNGVKT